MHSGTYIFFIFNGKWNRAFGKANILISKIDLKNYKQPIYPYVLNSNGKEKYYIKKDLEKILINKNFILINIK